MYYSSKKKNNNKNEPDSVMVKMTKNVTIQTRCFINFQDYELEKAVLMRGGQKQFQTGKTYRISAERGEDWVVEGWCEFVY